MNLTSNIIKYNPIIRLHNVQPDAPPNTKHTPLRRPRQAGNKKERCSAKAHRTPLFIIHIIPRGYFTVKKEFLQKISPCVVAVFMQTAQVHVSFRYTVQFPLVSTSPQPPFFFAANRPLPTGRIQSYSAARSSFPPPSSFQIPCKPVSGSEIVR